MEETWEPTSQTLVRYVSLLNAYVRDDVDHDTFVERFLRLWREDRDAGRATGAVIDSLMTGTDCYSSDPDPASPWEISGEQLRAEATQALSELDTP